MVADTCDDSYAYLSLTVARYAKEDALGKYTALLTLSPIYLAVAYMTLVVARRDLQVLVLAVGHLFDLVVNKVLKTWFAEARPPGCVNTGHGMPSNHTQYMFFFATFMSLYLWGRVSYCTEAKLGLTSALVGWAAGVGYSRICLQCHTLKQVVAGAAVGGTTGALWYLLYSKVLLPFLPRVAKWPISRALYVKDYSQVSHVLAFEHAALYGDSGGGQGGGGIAFDAPRNSGGTAIGRGEMSRKVR
ncbi:unnamed protein product [Scytosiphon promiscuus]